MLSDQRAGVGAKSLAHAVDSRINSAQIEAQDFKPGGYVYDSCQQLPFSLPPGRLERGGEADRSGGGGLGRHKGGGGEGGCGGTKDTVTEGFRRSSATTYIGPVFAHYGNASMIQGFARPGEAKHRSRASGYCL